MENVIGEHLSSLGSFRSLSLIFEIEPPFVKNSIFGNEVYQKGGIYRNGEKEGLWIRWYQNGQKWAEGNCRNGEEESLWIYWWSNGQKSSEGNYLNGKKDGIWIYWDENGQKLSEGNYRNGKLIEEANF